MTVVKMIERLKAFPEDMLVVMNSPKEHSGFEDIGGLNVWEISHTRLDISPEVISKYVMYTDNDLKAVVISDLHYNPNDPMYEIPSVTVDWIE